MCIAIVVAAALILVASVMVAQRQFLFSWQDLGRVLSHAAAVAVGALTVPLAIMLASEQFSAHVAVIVLTSIFGCGVTFFAIASLSRHAIAKEITKLLPTKVSGSQ